MTTRFTPENITTIAPNEVFAFGSNLGGFHGAGAARLAHLKFGALWGVGEGLCGQSYAFPTKDKNIKTLSLINIRISVTNLIYTCVKNPSKTFLLTKVGCGLAGLEIKDVAELFKVYLPLPPNLVLPKEFHDIIYG